MSAEISLEEVARNVNWYTEPSQLLGNVNLFLCQVMARGSADDIIATRSRFSWDEFRTAYQQAPSGLFSKRAWAYWGLMLLNDPTLPPPERFPGANLFDWRSAK